PMPAGMPGASPGLTIPVDIPPFHFQPRRVGVDWRRFGAIDVERVAREVDVAALQDHIASVTFCNLDGERCPHCGQPADPVLLKVLRMAQLSIEYLLHCQERLGTSLAAHAQRLQAARAELACAQQQAAEQATQLRGAKEESRRWKKLIATQQLLLQAGPDTYCKVRGGKELAGCTLAHGTSVSPGFAERQKMKQVEQMEDEVEELKAKLREMQQQLEVEREAEKLRREQEMERARQQEEDGRRDLERWKEEERTKLHEEIDGLRQLFLAAFKDVASRSSAVEGKLQELWVREAAVSNLGTLQNDDNKEARGQTPSWAELRGERERMAVQVSSTVPMACRSENKKGHKPGVDISRYPRGTSLTPALRVAEGCLPTDILQLVALLGKCPGISLRNVLQGLVPDLGQPWIPKGTVVPCVAVLVPAPVFTPDREEAALGGKQRLMEALQRNPNLLKQFRPILEEVLEEKLESMGVKRVVKGISTRTYRSLQALVRLQQQEKAEKFPGLLHLRDELVQALMGKVRRRKKPSTNLPQQVFIIPGEVTS
ncbi:DZI1L protein, partial [Grus americana]|nr:DZI1L protein [Grus americana]